MSQHTDCQYKVLERVYYVNFDELIKKIKTGNVLRHDSVKIGKSAWTTAENISELAEVFKEVDLKNTLPEDTDFQNIFTHFQAREVDYKAICEIENTLDKTCVIHTDKAPYYICTVCENLFCQDCPAPNAENSRFCPFCGGKCVLYMGQMWQFENKKSEAKYELEEEEDAAPPPLVYEDVYTALNFRDFIDAVIYPLRYPLSLLIGGILFSVLVLGQIVTLFKGGGWIVATAAIGAVIMMLKFGILSKCFENILRKDRPRQNYIPHIKKFGVIEDFVIPLVTGFHSYLVAFGVFIILAVAAGSYAWLSFTGDLIKTETEVLQAEQHANSVINAGKTDSTPAAQRREKEIRKMLDDLRLKRFEYVFGTNHLADNKQLERLVTSVIQLTLWLQMPLCFAFILGVLFFPAVCLSTNKNHSFSLKKSFVSSFKIMKTIGFDYLKILFMCFMLLMFTVLNIYTLNWGFAKLEMPAAGIFSTIIGGSFLIFYFWIVFSSILSTVLLRFDSRAKIDQASLIHYSRAPRKFRRIAGKTLDELVNH
jgi:hypothetical protein